MTRIVHISDLHFGQPAGVQILQSVKDVIYEVQPDLVAVSGDLTQSCTSREFAEARKYLDDIASIAPCVVVPGNHDIRWLGAVIRNLGGAGLLQEKAHEFKYSRYKKHISTELSDAREIPDDPSRGPALVVAGLNTSHGIIRGSLTTRLRDLGVVGHLTRADIELAREAFEGAPPGAARVVMIHHNPLRGPVSGRHGLAHTEQALREFAALGTELILCGHDHQDAVHTVERIAPDMDAPSMVISTAGTVSNRVQPGRASSFNLVEVSRSKLAITTYSYNTDGRFVPLKEASFPRDSGSF